MNGKLLINLKKTGCAIEKSLYLCSQKSIGEQSVDVHNLAMTFRESQPVGFFFLCPYRSNTILYLLAITFNAYGHFHGSDTD